MKRLWTLSKAFISFISLFTERLMRLSEKLVASRRIQLLSRLCLRNVALFCTTVLIVVTLLVRRSSLLTLFLTAHSVRSSTHDLVILFVSVCQCSNFRLLPRALLGVSVISYVG